MFKKVLTLLSLFFVNIDSHYLRANTNQNNNQINYYHNNYNLDNSSYINDDIRNEFAIAQPNGFLIESLNCENFKVGPGTTCGWIENYCEEQLGTSKFTFRGAVCNTEEPKVGKLYTCCEN